MYKDIFPREYIVYSNSPSEQPSNHGCFLFQDLAQETEVQAENIKWLNRAELEMLSDKNLSLREREKLSESLKNVNTTWTKVCMWESCNVFLLSIDF